MRHKKTMQRAKPKIEQAASKPRTLHIRHDRFFTLLGSFIVFATFVVKEGISENFKDLVSSIQTEENMFSVRQETAYRLSNGKSLPPPWSQTEPTRDEKRGFIDLWDRQSEAIVRISLDLATMLPDKNKFQIQADQINNELSEIDTGVDSLTAAPAAQQEETQIDASMKVFFKRSNSIFSDANLLAQDILDEANKLKEKREARYSTAKWLSYALFTFGWGLTFYGQISDKGAPSPETRPE
jgi:hypothetical protein